MATKKCPQCGALTWELAERCDCGFHFPRIQKKEISMPAAQARKPSPEIQTARNWYIWLWISPFITIPTLLLLVVVSPVAVNENELWIWTLLPVMGSALWHLILLYPAVNGKTEFIRWHGRQALLLAGARTVLALIAILPLSSGDESTFQIGVLLLILLWLAGNLWGQGQARRGDCALMRWTGHGAGLPLPVAIKTASAQPVPPPPGASHVDDLVNIIRFNPDPAARRAALAELERLNLVESL